MHTTLRLLALHMIIALLVGACSPATPQATPAPVPTEAAPATATPEDTAAPEATAAPADTEAPAATTAPEGTAGDCVRVGHGEAPLESTNLDPLNIASGVGLIYQGLIYNRLTDLDASFAVQPELAESWEPNADGTEWTFHLREGVKWHDGSDFTADDVAYTFQRLIDPANNSEAAPSLSFLTAIEALDPLTVVFRTEQTVAELPNQITIKNAWILKNGTSTEDIMAGSIGTGPFLLPEDFDPAANTQRFIANPNYWESGLPKAPCIEFSFLTEAATRNAALLAGEIDLATSIDPTTVADFEGNADFTIIPGPAATPLTFAMWTDSQPFDDPRVRQALKLVLDRRAIVDVAFNGYATIGDDNPIPPTSSFAWRPEGEVPGPDVAAAEALLAEAGYGPGNPLQIDLHASEIEPGVLTMAQLFAEQAAQAGIEINLIQVPVGEFWDNTWLKQPFVTSGWSPRGPVNAFHIPFRTEYNDTHWSPDEFVTLLDSAATTVDEDARAQVYKDVGRMVTEDGGFIVPAFIGKIAVMSAACQEYEHMIDQPRIDLSTIHCER